MTHSVSGHPWEEETLVCKARLYNDQMEEHPAESWQFGLWSALSLEFLARAALAHISPLLLADSKSDWRNLAYALGKDPTSARFLPKSISIREVLSRLSELPTGLNNEIADFCVEHAVRRNAELHSGQLAFAGIGTSEWLPKYYLACDVLLKSMDRELADFVSEHSVAQEMIESLRDAAAQAVNSDIKAHRKAWSGKSSSDRDKASRQAETWAMRSAGHCVVCPACNSQSLLHGNPSGPVTTEVDGEMVVERQTLSPSAFECIACGLRISGFSKLLACGLGDAFTRKSTYSAAEFFGLHTDHELEEALNAFPEWEPDFNEY